MASGPYVYPRISPVPTLSLLSATSDYAGIVLAASHNPAPYNGFKVYNGNGGQITDEGCSRDFCSIARVNPFGDHYGL